MKTYLYCLLVLLFSFTALCYGSSWPLRLTSGEDQITIYPLQPDQLKEGVLSARAALAVIPAGQSNTVYGVMRLEARAIRDNDARTVVLKDFHVKDISLYDLSSTQEVQFSSAIALHSVTWDVSFSQDTLNAMLELAESSPFDLLERKMPRTAEVSRESEIEVTYDGEPRFEPIVQTRLYYAVNTDFQVVQDQDRYYCADRGIWFASSHPQGPWKATDHISDEIRSIPPSNALHNTRFLYVGDRSEETINYGFYPGYVNEGTHGARFRGWGIDYESPDYSIRVDPRGGSLYYRENSGGDVPRARKNWRRDYSKFPEFEK